MAQCSVVLLDLLALLNLVDLLGGAPVVEKAGDEVGNGGLHCRKDPVMSRQACSQQGVVSLGN